MPRPRRLLRLSPLAVLALFAAACSSSSGNGGAGTTDEGCLDGLTPAANAEFCEQTAAEPECGLVTPIYKNQVCGVPLKAPPGELARSSTVEEYAGSGPPRLDCFAPASYPPPAGASQPVTVEGAARIFSSGCESNDLTIEIWTVKRTGGEDDGMPDQIIGSAVTTPSDCEQAGELTETDNCDARWECKYSYPNVPTETELIIKTSGTFWSPLYEYNVFIPNSAVKDGKFAKDVRALARDDYTVIPQAAIGGPITALHGAVAGEIHDCDDVRLINAVVDIDVEKVIMTYYTSNEDHPLPDLGAKGTSSLGLYSALDVPPGPVTVAAAGLLGGQLVTAGFFRARVFEDAVTSVTFRGLRPFQVPQQ